MGMAGDRGVVGGGYWSGVVGSVAEGAGGAARGRVLVGRAHGRGVCQHGGRVFGFTGWALCGVCGEDERRSTAIVASGVGLEDGPSAAWNRSRKPSVLVPG